SAAWLTATARDTAVPAREAAPLSESAAPGARAISSALRPGEVGSQPRGGRAPIIGSRIAGSRIVERMIGGSQLLRVVAHHVRHDHPDAPLLVIEHDGGAAGFANAQLERPVGILIVERQAFQAAAPLDRQ